MNGDMLIGIHDESFRDALHFFLNKNNMPFEERLSIVVLTEEKADLQVAIQVWIGVGQLKLRKSKKSELLKTIVSGINEYYINRWTSSFVLSKTRPRPTACGRILRVR